MPEQLQKILDKVVEWWKKFNNKQRIIIISALAVVIISLIILVVVVQRPTYVELIRCEDSAQASEVTKLLDENSIQYNIDDKLVVTVDTDDEVNATMLLGENSIPAAAYSIDNVVNGSFSTTEADKQKKWVNYLESKFADHLSQLDFVESAEVDITMPDDDGTILSKDEEAKAAVILDLKREISEDQAYAIARLVATEIGNETVERITVIDKKGNIIYSGADANSATGLASSNLSYKQKLETMMKEEINNTLKESGIFSDIQTGLNLDVEFKKSNIAKKEYKNPDGLDSGIVNHEETYNSDAENTDAQEAPGTDANGDNTTYVTPDSSNSSSSISQTERDYSVDETITTIENNGGDINYDNSSVAVVATRYVVYDEETMESSGQLGDLSWEEFKAQNADPVKATDVDQDLVTMLVNTTGIAESNVSLTIYEQAQFVDKETKNIELSDILQIVLVILIFALLGFVVFRSIKSEKTEQAEPELSVETLLESTSEAQDSLEDIGYTEKSETRLLIEKFVDENPDAVALLLRNWLNEDWE